MSSFNHLLLYPEATNTHNCLETEGTIRSHLLPGDPPTGELLRERETSKEKVNTSPMSLMVADLSMYPGADLPRVNTWQKIWRSVLS